MLLDKNSLAVCFEDRKVLMAYGNREKVIYSVSINANADIFIDDNIIDTKLVVPIIVNFIRSNNIRPKNIMYVLKDEEVVVRNFELPQMPDASLQKSVEWEVGQYLPDEGKDYYISYELQEKINEKDRKAYKVMVAAAPKSKINRYVELTNTLGLKLRAIDFSSNCVARVFKDYFNANSSIKNIGIINIGINKSVITFLEEGRFAMQRQIPFGINNLARIVLQYMPIGVRDTSISHEDIIKALDLHLSDELNVRAQNIFTNAFGNLGKAIQFYTAGRVQKNIDQICFIGEGTEVKGLRELMENYFGVPIKKIDNVDDLNLKIRVSSGLDLKTYINNIGLLMRKE